jgi:hypothetical protein
VVDLSSWEEDTFPNISRDEEIAWKLFDNLNYGLLGLPSDGNAIILSDSNEKEEAHEDERIDAEAVSSSAGDEAGGVQDGSSGGGYETDMS